jgi:hypothetical protein
MPFVFGREIELNTLGVQIYRYVRVYDAVQRQQTKWFVFAIVVGFSFYAIYNVPGALVPGLSAPDSWYQLLQFHTVPGSGLGPVACALAGGSAGDHATQLRLTVVTPAQPDGHSLTPGQ